MIYSVLTSATTFNSVTNIDISVLVLLFTRSRFPGESLDHVTAALTKLTISSDITKSLSILAPIASRRPT